MATQTFSLLCAAVALQLCHGEVHYYQPEQMHISYKDPHTMIATWVTMNNTQPHFATCEYGKQNLKMMATGTTTEFTDGGSEKRKMYVHRVEMNGLLPDVSYLYHCGTNFYGWSAVFYFTTPKTSGPRKYAVFGDMGNKNARSLSRLQRAAQVQQFDMVLHVGDFAYNMDNDNARRGDQFMRQIEPMAAYVPYMVVPGNHEAAYNFSNYVNRFTMPRSVSQHYYSFDYGLVHFLGFSTEFYYYMHQEQVDNQRAWIVRDLQAAVANRHNVPWIITMGHRPMYCSDWDTDDCTKYESKIRKDLEELFYQSGVDLEIWAHEHSYERMWPLYNRTVYNGSAAAYTDPVAPVHIVTGSAGCQEDTDPFVIFPAPWSAFRSSNYGYTMMTVANATHLTLDEISDDLEGKIIDSITLIKHHHQRYTDMPNYAERVKAHYGVHVPIDYQGQRIDTLKGRVKVNGKHDFKMPEF